MRYLHIGIVCEEAPHGDRRRGETAGACCAAAAAGAQAGGGSAASWCTSADRVPLARCAQRGRHRCLARDAQRWAARPTGRGAARAIAAHPAGRTASGGLRHGFVDAEAGARNHQASLRRAVQRSARLAAAGQAGLFQPEAGEARQGAGRGRHRALEEAHLAGAKKKSRLEGRLIVFVDESGLSERPTRVRTWAPVGQTPVIQFHFNWKQLSMIAGLTIAHCVFRLYEGAIRSAQIVEFLKALRRHLKMRLLIVWDGLRAHRSRLVRDYVDSTEGTIQLAFLPAYAPELNPVEYLWAWLKRHAMANFCPDGIAELKSTARAKLKSAQRRGSIIAACWVQADLFQCHELW